MDWPNKVFPITGPPDQNTPFGTGFAVASDADGLLLVTCWHVVQGIGADRLHLDWHWPCELLSAPGDDDLDLAVLRVLKPDSEPDSESTSMPVPRGEPFALTAGACHRQPFKTFGYEPVGRPLSGTLGANTSRPHRSHQPVPAWDYYLEDNGQALEKIKDGYSGAPVCDADSGAVLAVITHRQGADKGFAIDISNLPRVYSRAADWLSQPGTATDADTDHDYLTDDGTALAKRLDHQDQRARIAALLAQPGIDRAIALVECRSRDWPQDLADHVQTEHASERDHGVLTAATELKLGLRTDARAFWQALVAATPGAAGQADPRAAVREFLCSRRVAVLYAPVNLGQHGRHLSEIIRGAHEDLQRLGEFADARVLVLIAGIRSEHRLPLWWRWWVRPRIKRLACCHALPRMRPLESADLEDWYTDFPASLRTCYNRDRLKSELLRLFDDGRTTVPYNEARCLLVGGDDGPTALDRARR